VNETEFFWPANVDTTFSLWGLEPRHLRRLLPVPLILVAGGVLTYLTVRLVPWTVIRVALITWFMLVPAGGYVWYCCVPRYPRGRTSSDLARAVGRHRKAQTVFQPTGAPVATSPAAKEVAAGA